MLKVMEKPWAAEDNAPTSSLPQLSAVSLIAMARRQWPVIAGCALLAFVLALGYVLTASPRYTASVKILIDTRKNNLLQKQDLGGETKLDAGAVESQVEVLKSEGVAQAVIRDQNLTADPEYVGGKGGSLFGSLFSLLDDGDKSVSQEAVERSVIQAFVRNTTAKRLGLTYVIQVDFTSGNASKSARIANAIADAYMVGELEAKYQSTRRASKWLQERLVDLRTQATQSDLAVQNFKAANNIVDTSRGLMGEQQLSDVNSQVVQARAETAQAKARLDRIQQIGRESASLPDATVADALRNDVINRSRAQYLDLARREADLAARYGPGHAAAVNLRNQMGELRRNISDELSRIAQTYESDYQIAKAREDSLQKSLNGLVTEAGTTSQAQVKVRELESSSQTYRNLYDSFLQKFEDATQQQTFPITDARVITAATEPAGKSSPKTMLILLAGTILGLGIGVGAAGARELLNTAMRTPDDVEQATGLKCLGTLPAIAELRTDGRSSVGQIGELGGKNYVVNAPFSRYAEVLRNVKVSLDVVRLSRDVKVIGIVSSLPREGKTTVASNLARIIARGGQRILLIDGDLRNPSLTRQLAPNAEAGLVEVLSSSRAFHDVVIHDQETGFDFLPAVVPHRLANTAELVASPAMDRLLQDSRGAYEYILVDLPPLISVVDARAAANLIDTFLFVVQWGQTTRSAAVEALSSSEIVRERSIGAVLNDADPRALKRIEFYKGQYHNNYYVSDRAR